MRQNFQEDFDFALTGLSKNSKTFGVDSESFKVFFIVVGISIGRGAALPNLLSSRCHSGGYDSAHIPASGGN
jgi:hypothetical protein